MSATTNNTAASTNPGDRSPAEIERDVERTRARVADTLEQLRDKLSPGQMVDELLAYARGSGGADFARNAGTAIRDNPVPVLLIGAGIAWLMASGSRQPRHHYYAEAEPRHIPPGRPLAGPMPPDMGPVHRAVPPPMTGTATGAAASAPTLSEVGRPEHSSSGVGDRVSGAASSAKDRAAGAASSAAGAASSAKDRAAGAASSAYETAAGAASSAYHGAAEAASSTYHGAADAASSAYRGARHTSEWAYDSAQRGFGWMIQEQPLVLGAIGLAIGAAIGAALPRTETEDRMMGETREDLARRAREAAREGYEQVRDRAAEHAGAVQGALSETAGEAKARMDRSGVSVEGTGKAAGDVAHKVGEAVRDAVHEAAQEAKGAMGAGSREGATARPGDDAARRSTAPGTSTPGAPGARPAGEPRKPM